MEPGRAPICLNLTPTNICRSICVLHLPEPRSGGFKPWSLVGEGVARHMLRLERAIEPALGRFAAFRMLLIVEKSSATHSAVHHGGMRAEAS